MGIANLGTGKKGDAENHFANSQKLVNQSLQIKESSQGYRLLADTYMQLMPVKGFFYSAANGGRLKSLPQKAIKRNPQNYKAHISLALFYIHAPAFGGGSIAKGIEMLLVALKSAEKVDRFNAYMWLGIIYQKEKNYQEAMLYLNKALAIYPNNGWAKQTLEAVAAQSN